MLNDKLLYMHQCAQTFKTCTTYAYLSIYRIKKIKTLIVFNSMYSHAKWICRSMKSMIFELKSPHFKSSWCVHCHYVNMQMRLIPSVAYIKFNSMREKRSKPLAAEPIYTSLSHWVQSVISTSLLISYNNRINHKYLLQKSNFLKLFGFFSK